jgi:hypothetical protein
VRKLSAAHGITQQNHVAQFGKIAQKGRDLLHAEPIDYNGTGLGLIELVAQKLASKVGIDRDLDDTGPGTGENQHNVFDPVLQHDREPIALTQPEGLQACRQAIGLPIEVSERQPSTAALYEVAIGIRLRLLPQPVTQDP